VSPKPESPAITPSNVLPLLYSIDEVCIALGGISSRTVYNLLNAGQLVRRKIGGRSMVPVSSVEAFVRRDHPTGQEGKRPRTRRGSR